MSTNIIAELRYLKRVKGIAVRFCDVGIRHEKSGSAEVAVSIAAHSWVNAMGYASEDCKEFDRAMAGGSQ